MKASNSLTTDAQMKVLLWIHHHGASTIWFMTDNLGLPRSRVREAVVGLYSEKKLYRTLVDPGHSVYQYDLDPMLRNATRSPELSSPLTPLLTPPLLA